MTAGSVRAVGRWGAKAAVVTALLLLVGCEASTPSATNSGVEGVALAGPQCPVEIAGSPCPDKPIAIRVVVRDQTGSQVTVFETGADGTFRISLPPGRYSLSAADPVALPFLRPTDVTVADGTYVWVELDVDTGIR
jgi:hypothetical protein